jgi:tRNA(adenine34) deaminase
VIWERLSPIWQCCIEEAWAAYCHGSLPHGAVVTDAQGNIVGKGRNRIRERSAEGRQFAANRLAHAELNALVDMDWRAVDVYGCKLSSHGPHARGAVCCA